MASDSKVVKSLFKGGAIVFLGLVFSKLIGLVYRVLVGRFLGPEAYGIISVMIAVFSVAAIIAYVGIPQGVQKYIADFRGKNDIAGQVGAARIGLIMVTASSVVTGLALFLLAPWIATEIFNDPRTIWPIRFVALVLPFRGFRKVFTSITEGYEKMQYKVYALHLYANITKVLLTAIVIWLGYGYLEVAGVFAFAYGTAFIVAGYFAYKMLPEAFKPGIKGRYETKKIFSHSWPLFAAGLLTVVAGYIDTFMLQAFLGSREVGLYNAAYPFAALITIGSSIFGSIYLSNASKLYGQGKTSEMSSAYRLIVKWISLATIPVFLILFMFPVAALQVFGAEYLEMDNVLRILSIGFLASALIGPVNRTLQAIERTKINLYITLFTGTTNIGLNYLLIPTYGVIGAATATATTFILAFILKFAIIYKLTGSQPFRPVIGKIVLSGLIAALTVYGIARILFESTPHWYIIPATLTFGAVYTALIVITRTIEKEDLEILKYIREKTDLENPRIEKIIRKYAN